MCFCKRKIFSIFVVVIVLLVNVPVSSFADSDFFVVINKLSSSEKAREFNIIKKTNPSNFTEEYSSIPHDVEKYGHNYEIINIDITYQVFSPEDSEGFQEITERNILKNFKVLVCINEYGEKIHNFDEPIVFFMSEDDLIMGHQEILNEVKKLAHVNSVSEVDTVAELYFGKNTRYRNMVFSFLEELGFFFF